MLELAILMEGKAFTISFKNILGDVCNCVKYNRSNSNGTRVSIGQSLNSMITFKK